MVNPAQKIFEANSESLYDFISKNGRGLYIPPYQRDYAWDKGNVDRLIDDTVQGLNSLLTKPDESITFIGTIITMNDAKKQTIDPLVKNQVYGQVMTVIDGQQRLTTLLMMCLVLLIEIETQWSRLRTAKVVSDETRNWIETRVNDMRGLLSQMLAEKQNNGIGEFRFFPKIIRAFIDAWSYEADKAAYNSPIAWLLFEYIKFRESASADWSKFLTPLQKSIDAVDSERKHFLKLMKLMQKRFKSLPSDDEFPDLLEIVQDVSKQEILFGEEFPLAMRSALKAILENQSHGIILNEAGEVELEVEDPKAKQWWGAATELISLLVFSRFSLERITLVVVTATTEDFAFDVFEALNTTGQPLTAIETFTPKVVQAVGLTNYNASEEKKQIDSAFAYLKKSTRAEERHQRSAELLVAFALAESGEKRSKNLADQRRFMREKFDTYKDSPAERQNFIRHLADLSRFFDSAWVDASKKPKIGDFDLDDQVALCLRFLVDIGHTITVPLLAQYAAEVATATDTQGRKDAVSEFGAVVKAVAAFSVLWRASRTTTDRIEQVFRDLMSKDSPEQGMSALARGLRGDKLLPKANEIQAVLVARLKADRKNGGANIDGKQEWIEKVVSNPIYDVNTKLARFVLLAAFHDAVEGPNGTLVAGKANTQSTLNFDSWVGDRYATVEHIAPQSRGSNGWDANLYNDDEFERLGNLTLLPLSPNQSLSNRPWNEKRALFGALAANTSQESDQILNELKRNGVDISAVATTIYCGHFLPHVHVISQIQGDWNLISVEQRGRNLSDLAWNNLAPWLGLD